MTDASDELPREPGVATTLDVAATGATGATAGSPDAVEAVGPSEPPAPSPDAPTDAPAADEPVDAPAADEPVDAPAADEPVDAPAVGTPATEDPTGSPTPEGSSLAAAALPIGVGVTLLLLVLNVDAGATAALALVALTAYRARARWLAAGAAAWTLVLLSVLVFPNPYDSWAAVAAIPVVTGYAGCFLAGWALGRRFAGRGGRAPGRPRPELVWPSERRLRGYLLVMLALGLLAAVLRYHGVVPPLFAGNPDAQRQVLRQQANLPVGLLSEAWTLGMAVSLLRVLTGHRRGRLVYLALAVAFTLGAALGASKNSVLVGIAPALVAALSVRRSAGPSSPGAGYRSRLFVKPKPQLIVLLGIVVIGAAVFLGGQRTLAGTGEFETAFRAEYGNNPIAASVGSLDLSLSSSTETFGRLWAQRSEFRPRYGAYSLAFLGSHEQPIFGKVDLYALTSQLSEPYYMNTATFIAIPLLDYGPVGAAFVLLILGLAVGLAERRLEFSGGPAQQVGRGLVVYFALFGVYELYPAIYPTWLSLIPGLLCLYLLGRRR